MVPVRTFDLAPMDLTIRAVTFVILALPLPIAVLGLLSPNVVPLLGISLFIVALFVATWIWFRPTRFEVSPDALRIVWPARRASFARREISGVERVSRADLSRELGWMIRLGAGGLWGAFGMLLTTRGPNITMYVSRQSDMLLVRFHGSRRPLLITPKDPDAFIAALQ